MNKSKLSFLLVAFLVAASMLGGCGEAQETGGGAEGQEDFTSTTGLTMATASPELLMIAIEKAQEEIPVEDSLEISLRVWGFKVVVVSINGGAVDVVINSAELTDEERALIVDIVYMETGIPPENITISTVTE